MAPKSPEDIGVVAHRCRGRCGDAPLAPPIRGRTTEPHLESTLSERLHGGTPRCLDHRMPCTEVRNARTYFDPVGHSSEDTKHCSCILHRPLKFRKPDLAK